MQRFRDFLKRKDIEISLRRYGIDALSAMAQGLFCSLLIGTILNTLGQQFHIGFLNAIIFTLGKGDAAVGYTIGDGAVFSRPGRLCDQRHGRRRRPAGRARDGDRRG